MSPKIAIVTPTFPPYRGGIGKVAEMDARQLAAAGYEVTVLTPTRGAVHESASGVTVKEIKPVFRYGNAALTPGISAALAPFPLVILHYPFFGTAEFLSLHKRRFPEAKILLEYHMDVIGRGWLRSFFRWHSDSLLPKIVRSTDRVVATSFDYLRSSNIAGFFREQPDAFRELAPSVDPERFQPGAKPAALMDRYGLKVTDKVILFVGGLDKAHYFKGVSVLLRAAASAGLASSKLLIVGDGDLKPSYQDEAARLGISERVIFTGGVSDDELPDHYRAADVFAFPSIDKSEAFGVAALEALSSGLPVVAADLPGVRTIVRRDETGYCVRPGSASALAVRLVDLLADDVSRQRFGAAARRMVLDEYSDDQRRKRLLQIVQELIHSAK